MKNIVISFCVMLLSASSLAEVQSQSATPTRRPLSRVANRSIVSGTATTNGVTWSYSVVNDAVVLGYFGFQRSAAVPQDTAGALIIPDVLDGKLVRDIRPGAFHDCTNLTSVTIPSCVTNIGEGAFVGCKSLKEFVVADGNVAYSTKDGVLFDAERTRLICCPAAKSGEYVIPTGVVAVDTDAFNGCCLLTSVTIPSSVADIGEGAFYDCRSLKEFVIAEGNDRYSSIDGVLFDTKRKVLLRCRIGKSGKYVIPSSVTSVGEYAFAGCRSLASVTIPPSVTNIDEGAFSDCSSLTAVTIPPGVTEINAMTFDSCTNLTSVTIPSSVTNIGWYAFSDCRGLTSVTIPPSVMNIGVWAFSDCSSLTSVTIPPSVTNIGSYAFSGCSLLSSVTITSGETSIGWGAFSHCRGLTSVTISDGVTKINARSFASCTNLTSVTIPPSVTSIGDGAFSGCRGLTSVTIPSSVTSIGGAAFSGCRGLTSVTMPAGVTNIGRYAFSDCSGLTSVKIPSSVTSIGEDAFSHCSGLTSVAIPSGVTNIGGGAFSGCCGLTSVTIPAGVTNIGRCAFSDCRGLTSVTIPSSVTSIGGGVFSGCRGLTFFVVDKGNPYFKSENGLLLTKDGASLIAGINADVTIPSGVTSIGADAFFDCNGLTSVTIPSSVTSIGGCAFSGCRGLTSVSMPVGVTNIGRRAFSACSGLTSVTIPSSVTSVGDGAFSGCRGLTSVTIPSSVTNIGSCAFESCTNLTSVIIPPSVVRIGSLSFAYCEALSSVTIPSSVKEVNREAFRRCLKLKSVNVVKDGKIEVVALKDFLDQKAPVAKTSGLKGRSGSLVRRPALRNMLSGSSGKEESLLGSRRQSQLTTSNRSLSRPTVNRPIARGTATTNGVTWSYSVVNGAVVLGSVGPSRRSSAVPQDTAGALIIPDVLDGKPVRDIRPGAFHYCTNLTSVTIPSMVTNIDCRAFDDCTNLKIVDVVSDGKVERMPVADFLKRYARLSSSNGSGMTDGIGGPSRSAGHRPGSLLSRRSQHQRTVEQDSARRAAARPDGGAGRDESNASKHELEDERAEQRRQLQAIQEELKRARQVRDAADRK